MKKVFARVLLVSCLGLFSLIPLSLEAFAASHNASYSFLHQVSVKKSMTATKTSLSGKVSGISWGGDTSFHIKVFHQEGPWYWKTTVYDGGTYFSPNGNKEFFYNTKKDLTYSAELWKNSNGKRIQGDISFSY